MKNPPQDFDERVLMELPACDSDESDDTLWIYMSLAYTRESPSFREQASVRFVSSGGLECSLIALPFESLKKLAAFIQETIQDYEGKS